MATSIGDARRAKAAIAAAMAEVLPLAGIGLTKVGGEYAVRVNLAHETDLSSLPREQDGVSVVYEVVGQLQKRID